VIEIAPRDDAERALWNAALDLAHLLDGLPWTLVGAQMVMLHAFAARISLPGQAATPTFFSTSERSRVQPRRPRRLVRPGLEEAGRSTERVAHRFAKGKISRGHTCSSRAVIPSHGRAPQ